MINDQRFPATLVCLALISLFALQPPSLRACHSSSIRLDSIVPAGGNFDIYTTLCIGGGVLGATQGANAATVDFAFGFYSACTSTINISYFPPQVTGDSTGNTATGVNIGPVASAPFGTQGTIYYSGANPLLCISNTSVCGLPHTQCFPMRFRVDVVPDSLRVFGVEGNGNPTGGCYPASAMLLDFTTLNPGGSCCPDLVAPGIVCPPGDTIFVGSAACLAVLPSYIAQVVATDNCTASPVVGQSPGPGTNLTPGTVSVVMSATDNANLGANCLFSVAVLDSTPPVAVCGNTTLYFDGNGQAVLTAAQADSGSTDNCAVQQRSVSSSVFTCPGSGAATAWLRIEDQSGNLDSCVAAIALLDTLSPVLTCPPGLSLNALSPYCGGVVNFGPAGAADNCGLASLVSHPASGSYFPVGTSPVTFTAADATGNTDSCTFNVTIQPAPPINASFIFTPNGNLSYAFTDLSAANPIAWAWDFGDGGSSGQPHPVHSYAAGGNYTVCLISSDSCTSDTTCQMLNVVGLEDGPGSPELRVFPNPNQGEFRLEFAHGLPESLEITVFDATGRRLIGPDAVVALSGNTAGISMPASVTGVCFVVVSDGKGRKVLPVWIR